MAGNDDVLLRSRVRASFANDSSGMDGKYASMRFLRYSLPCVWLEAYIHFGGTTPASPMELSAVWLRIWLRVTILVSVEDEEFFVIGVLKIF